MTRKRKKRRTKRKKKKKMMMMMMMMMKRWTSRRVLGQNVQRRDAQRRHRWPRPGLLTQVRSMTTLYSPP